MKTKTEDIQQTQQQIPNSCLINFLKERPNHGIAIAEKLIKVILIIVLAFQVINIFSNLKVKASEFPGKAPESLLVNSNETRQIIDSPHNQAKWSGHARSNIARLISND